MKMKSLLTIAVSFIAATLYAASMAGATTLVSGSDNPSAYASYFVDEAGDIHSVPHPDGTDPHPIAVTSPAGPWVSGSWMTYSNPNQKWPMDSGSGSLPGKYFYLTKFDLTGLNPATAIIRGSWSADNGSAFYFNDTFINTTGTTGYTGLTQFTITDGFNDTENFLTFVVTNDHWGDDPYTNPTGLLVNIYEATAAPVPEPSTLLLLGGGLMAVCFARRRAQG